VPYKQGKYSQSSTSDDQMHNIDDEEEFIYRLVTSPTGSSWHFP
jgi:hypothetical protein